MARNHRGEKVDAVVVGSGASGSVVAAKLAQAGKSVVVLEAGPELKLTDLYSSTIWARRLKWGGPPALTGGPDPIGVAGNSGWGTGGAALHHYAVWLRLHPEDFEVRTRFGVGLDWPIAYDDLRPYYDRIQEEAGISGDAEAEVWRPAGDPYPMPPLKQFNQARVIARGFEALGMRTAPTPLAINSEEYKGRPACIYDGWCESGCPIGALVNPLAVYLPQALEAGAEIRHDSYVTRVLTTVDGARATGVEYVDAQGVTEVQEADVVVLAAFAIENPRILLNSATDKHQNGLANGSGAVGRYMMAHPLGVVFGLFPDDMENYMGVTGGQMICQEEYEKDPAKGYIGAVYWGAGLALKPNDLLGIANARLDLFGADLHRFVEDASRHLGILGLFAENLPNAENRLTLSATTDARGMPRAELIHAVGEDDVKAYDAGMARGQEVMTAAGATEVWASARAGAHIMGGTIMGDDPAASVTTSYGQTHDVPNLFLAGPGLFPTSGAVNPTFTIHALSLRTAEYVAANL
ncbi:MAG: GMC family oxidoreductase [Thermomicrobiales bacterium]